MTLFNFLFFISFLSFLFFLPIFLFISVRDLYKSNKKKDKNVFQYKIDNFYWNGIKVFLYIFFFGILLNILRFFVSYNLCRHEISLDLKPSIINFILFIAELYYSNLFLFFYVLILILLSLICGLLFWRTVHKHFLHELFSLYIYVYSTSHTPWMCEQDLAELRKKRNNIYFIKFIQYYQFCEGNHGYYDLIRHFIITFILQISSSYKRYYDIPSREDNTLFLRVCRKLLHLASHRITAYLFFLSPILIFSYDCIFNNFVINHAIYWVTIYIPIVQYYRLLNAGKAQLGGMVDLLYDIYYGNDNYTYCVPKKLRPLFEYAIINKCQYIIGLDGIQNADFSLLVYNFRFKYDSVQDKYINYDDIEIKKISKDKYIQYIELEQEENGENGEQEKQEEWNYIAGKNPEKVNKDTKVSKK
jgi:hypothetical protein